MQFPVYCMAVCVVSACRCSHIASPAAMSQGIGEGWLLGSYSPPLLFMKQCRKSRQTREPLLSALSLNPDRLNCVYASCQPLA